MSLRNSWTKRACYPASLFSLPGSRFKLLLKRRKNRKKSKRANYLVDTGIFVLASRSGSRIEFLPLSRLVHLRIEVLPVDTVEITIFNSSNEFCGWLYLLCHNLLGYLILKTLRNPKNTKIPLRVLKIQKLSFSFEDFTSSTTMSFISWLPPAHWVAPWGKTADDCCTWNCPPASCPPPSPPQNLPSPLLLGLCPCRRDVGITRITLIREIRVVFQHISSFSHFLSETHFSWTNYFTSINASPEEENNYSHIPVFYFTSEFPLNSLNFR